MSLHIKGFGPYVTQEEVNSFFYTYAGFHPRSVKITQTGAVLVSFNDRETAKIAKEKTNGVTYNSSELEVFYFEPKEIRDLNRLQLLDRREQE